MNFKTMRLDSPKNVRTAEPMFKRNCSTAKLQSRALKRILGKCEEERGATGKDLARAQTAKRKVKRRLTRMQGVLEKQTRLVSKKEMARCLKLFSSNKYLFIYGKEGRGRYLDHSCKDYVKRSDQMTKINPQYKFMIKQMDLGD